MNQSTTHNTRILKLLAESRGMKFTSLEIADALNANRKSICVFVRGLHEKGEIKSDRTGTRTSVAASYWLEERPGQDT